MSPADSPDPGDELPLVLVTVGTDHHPFGRLVGWVDEWLAGRSGPQVRCLIQHGSAPPPRLADAVEILPYDELAELAGRAAAVVCQAGPASVAMCRELGRKPIVVPRSCRLGEHVDDHQIAFAQRLGEQGRALTVAGPAQLAAALERALAEPRWLEAERGDAGAVAATVRRFAAIADPLIAGSTARGERPPRLLPRLSRTLDRAAYVRLAGFTRHEYESLRLDRRSRAEARAMVSSAQAHNLIRPALNEAGADEALEDKWRFAHLVAERGLSAPRTLGRFDARDGRTWGGAPLRGPGDLQALLERERPEGLVVKPVRGRQGQGVIIGDLVYDGGVALRTARGELALDRLAATMGGAERSRAGGFVIQERVRPHVALRAVWPDLVGSIRVMSLLRRDGGVSIEAAAARFGRRGVSGDSYEHGAICCPVENLRTGRLGAGVSALEAERGAFATHPDTGAGLQGLELPCWPDVRRLVERAASAFPRVRSIGWDVGVTDRGPVLIEGNEDWGCEVVQLHGRGLLTPALRAELAAAGVSSPEAVPTAGMALRRLRGRLRRRSRSRGRRRPRAS